jgi:hypothetical protein
LATREEARCQIAVGDGWPSRLPRAAALLRDAVKALTGVSLPITQLAAPKADLPLLIVSLLRDGPVVRHLAEADVLSISDKAQERVSNHSRYRFLADDLGEQGFLCYATRWHDRRALILAANAPQGGEYGASTLADRLCWDGDRLVLDRLHTRHLPVVQIPAYPIRSVATNIGGPDWLGNNQWEREWASEGGYDYRGFIDWLAGHKINQLILWPFDLAFGIAYPSERFPECVNPYHPNVKDEFMGEMIDYAHQRHITVFFFLDFPDNWTAVVRAHPELAGKNVDTAALRHLEPSRWEAYQRQGRVGTERLRALFSWVCASHPGTMRFWEAYLRELLDRYPQVDGIGGQFAEHAAYHCDCPTCEAEFFERQWAFFQRMAEIAAAKIPGCRFWAYRSWGARDIWRNRYQLPGGLIWIDWGDSAAPLATNKALPRGHWYLYHRSKDRWYEYGLGLAARCCHQVGIRGLQIRGVYYRELDRIYQAFEEYAWNPSLGVADYADLYVQKRLRRRDAALADAYALGIEAQGLREMADDQRTWPAWQAEEDYAGRAARCETALQASLRQLAPSDFAAELRAAAG